MDYMYLKASGVLHVHIFYYDESLSFAEPASYQSATTSIAQYLGITIVIPDADNSGKSASHDISKQATSAI